MSVSTTFRATPWAALALIAASGSALAAPMNLGPAVIVMVTPPEAINAATQTDDPITTPAFADRSRPGGFDVSASVVNWRGPRTIAALAITGTDSSAPLPSPESAPDSEGAVNYLGEKVVAASIRYVNDFETGEVGPEWGAFGIPIVHEALSTYVSPAVEGGMVLNVKTDADAPYEIRLDVYLLPPPGSDIFPGEGDDLNEPADNTLSVLIDGQVVSQFSPRSLRKMQGERPRAGQPLVRKVRVPFNAGHQITEIRFESSSPEGSSDWSSWGMDNLIIDLGLQDPVFGIVSGDDPFAPGTLGMVSPNAGLTGEIPGLPGSRYATNAPFQGSDGGGSSSPPRFPPQPPIEEDPTEEPNPGEDNPPPDEPPPVIPSPPTAVLIVAALGAMFHRRR